jgi:hypothetical protein
MSKNALNQLWKVFLSLGFLCESWTVRFGKPDGPIFPENSYMQSFGSILTLILSNRFQTAS